MNRDSIIEGEEYAVSTGFMRPTPRTPGRRAKVLDLRYPTGETRWVNGNSRPEMGIRVELLGSDGAEGEPPAHKVLRNAGFVIAPWGEYEEQQQARSREAKALEATREMEKSLLHRLCAQMESQGLTDPEDFRLYGHSRIVNITPSGAKKLIELLATPFS